MRGAKVEFGPGNQGKKMNRYQELQIIRDVHGVYFHPESWEMPTESQARRALVLHNNWLTGCRRNCTNEGTPDSLFYLGAIARINAYLVFLRSGVYEVFPFP
jgi:hypothetical protein